jgi:excisionase family DNA binding protein
MPKREEFMQVTDAAKLLGVSPNTIRNWGRENKLPEYRHPVNNYRLYRRSDLEKLRKALMTPKRVGHAVSPKP